MRVSSSDRSSSQPRISEFPLHSKENTPNHSLHNSKTLIGPTVAGATPEKVRASRTSVERDEAAAASREMRPPSRQSAQHTPELRTSTSRTSIHTPSPATSITAAIPPSTTNASARLPDSPIVFSPKVPTVQPEQSSLQQNSSRVGDITAQQQVTPEKTTPLSLLNKVILQYVAVITYFLCCNFHIVSFIIINYMSRKYSNIFILLKILYE